MLPSKPVVLYQNETSVRIRGTYVIQSIRLPWLSIAINWLCEGLDNRLVLQTKKRLISGAERIEECAKRIDQ